MCENITQHSEVNRRRTNSEAVVILPKVWNYCLAGVQFGVLVLQCYCSETGEGNRSTKYAHNKCCKKVLNNKAAWSKKVPFKFSKCRS